MAVSYLTDEDIKMIHTLARDDKIGDRVLPPPLTTPTYYLTLVLYCRYLQVLLLPYMVMTTSSVQLPCHFLAGCLKIQVNRGQLHVQWNLSIVDTIGNHLTVLIVEVSIIRGSFVQNCHNWDESKC